MNHQSSWDLAWCYEHCYKRQSGELKREIETVSRKNNGSLLCFKKANTYSSWSSTSASKFRPFALLADWREAKPCVEAFAEGARPLVTFIYAETAQTLRRASAWAVRLDPSLGQVHVCSSVAELAPLLIQALGPWQLDSCRKYPWPKTVKCSTSQHPHEKIDITTRALMSQMTGESGWQSAFRSTFDCQGHANQASSRVADKTNEYQRYHISLESLVTSMHQASAPKDFTLPLPGFANPMLSTEVVPLEDEYHPMIYVQMLSL